MQLSCGCGCIGIVPALIAFGLALIFGVSFLKAVGIAILILGIFALIGLVLDFIAAITS